MLPTPFSVAVAGGETVEKVNPAGVGTVAVDVGSVVVVTAVCVMVKMVVSVRKGF